MKTTLWKNNLDLVTDVSMIYIYIYIYINFFVTVIVVSEKKIGSITFTAPFMLITGFICCSNTCSTHICPLFRTVICTHRF